MSTSIFLNPRFTTEWREASSRTIKQDPNNQAALYVHVALSAIQDLQAKQLADSPLKKRHEIFAYIHQSANTGYPRAMFLEGLALKEGFGCKQDIATGEAFIRVAAVGRNCDIAINYLNFRLGLAYLFGKHMPQSYEKAIKCLKLAGNVAAPELKMVAEHLTRMQVRLAPKPKPHTYDFPQVAYKPKLILAS